MRYVLIPPHVRHYEHELIWQILFNHRLDPKPLDACAKHLFTREQVECLCAMVPDREPIPAFNPNHPPYVMVELRAKELAAPIFLSSALSATVEGSARIPLWEGGTKINRPLRSPYHPNKFLRSFLITFRDPEAANAVFRYFHNNEAEAA